MASTTNGGPAGAPPQGVPPAGTTPQLSVLAQYVKDFSFENPNAPRSLGQTDQPQIGISVNVTANPLSETEVEVELRLDGKAESNIGVMFHIELVFAGVFQIQNVPQENIQPLMLIECPRLLFPFAREIVSNAVRNGGFPPLLLDPIDFVALYQQRLSQPQTPPPPAAA